MMAQLIHLILSESKPHTTYKSTKLSSTDDRSHRFLSSHSNHPSIFFTIIMSTKTLFFTLSDDLILQILYTLENDPRHWARLSCVCTKLSSLIRHICCKSKCYKTIPSITSDLVSSSPSSTPSGGWPSLHKLCVCCPGLHHAGILLENTDFGLERELGPDEMYPITGSSNISSIPPPTLQNLNLTTTPTTIPSSDCSWSLYDDLYFDTVYDISEKEQPVISETVDIKPGVVNKKRRISSSNGTTIGTHMASGVGNLCREQGNKLLGSRFRDDCLYISDRPGCVHSEEKRSYMLFRGIFKDFKKSQVWRTINDGKRSRIELGCAFCECDETWDLHSAFCLKRIFGYHDNGEPVVRAYVCENGHVSGAWTDRPMYS